MDGIAFSGMEALPVLPGLILSGRDTVASWIAEASTTPEAVAKRAIDVVAEVVMLPALVMVRMGAPWDLELAVAEVGSEELARVAVRETKGAATLKAWPAGESLGLLEGSVARAKRV